MKKSLKYSLIGLGAILIAVFLVLTLSLDYLVKSSIEEVGSEMAGTTVTVESVSVSPFTGSGSIEGIEVDNPEGFETEHALRLGRMDIRLDLGTVLSDTLIIEEIIIHNPAVSVTQKVPENNLKILMDNMESAMASGSEGSSMLIKRLVMREGQVVASHNVGGSQSAKVRLESFELTNVGSGGENATRQVVNKVAGRIMDEALKAALQGGIDQLKEEAGDAIEELINSQE